VCVSNKTAQIEVGSGDSFGLNDQNWLRLGRDVDECKPLPAWRRRSSHRRSTRTPPGHRGAPETPRSRSSRSSRLSRSGCWHRTPTPCGRVTRSLPFQLIPTICSRNVPVQGTYRGTSTRFRTHCILLRALQCVSFQGYHAQRPKQWSRSEAVSKRGENRDPYDTWIQGA
jgi:hypothetical protein